MFEKVGSLVASVGMCEECPAPEREELEEKREDSDHPRGPVYYPRNTVECVCLCTVCSTSVVVLVEVWVTASQSGKVKLAGTLSGSSPVCVTVCVSLSWVRDFTL